jgi:hypothetical protein
MVGGVETSCHAHVYLATILIIKTMQACMQNYAAWRYHSESLTHSISPDDEHACMYAMEIECLTTNEVHLQCMMTDLSHARHSHARNNAWCAPLNVIDFTATYLHIYHMARHSYTPPHCLSQDMWQVALASVLELILGPAVGMYIYNSAIYTFSD